MNFRRRARRAPYLAITVAGAALCGLAPLAAPVAAFAAHPAATSPAAGYVYFQFFADPFFNYSSLSGDSDGVAVDRVNTGQYQVTFAGMGSIAGKSVVQVSTSDGITNCAVGSWFASGKDLQADVDCFLVTTGAPADSQFTLLVTHPSSPPHGTFDYSLNTRANTSGKLTSFQFNSAHKQNSIKHLSTGKYQLTLGGPKTTGTQGVVKLSAFGDAPGDCELNGWKGSAAGELVNVDCYTPGHVLADRDFIITYASANSMMGINGQVVANAFANSKAAVYQPAVQYDSSKGAKVTVVHLDLGQYSVLPAGSSGNAAKFGGDVQVSAVGSKGRHCSVLSWNQELTPALVINCVDLAGHLADTPFTVEWVVP